MEKSKLIVILTIILVVFAGISFNYVIKYNNKLDENGNIALDKCKSIFTTKNKNLAVVPYYNEVFKASESFKNNDKRGDWIDIKNDTDFHVGASNIIKPVPMDSSGEPNCYYTIHRPEGEVKYIIPLNAISGSGSL